MISITSATDPASWDRFLIGERFSPFLQSWTMGEVYRAIGQEPVRLEVRDGDAVTGVCFGHIVPARRGKHLSIPYGPVLRDMTSVEQLLQELKRIALEHRCAFIRVSPFWLASGDNPLFKLGAKAAPLHLLAEHLWYVPLTKNDAWTSADPGERRTEEEIQKEMRATARNLIRRAAKDGVEIALSDDPVRDLPHFITLHDETRKRHGFTPYTDAFFRAQVELFSKDKQVLLYMARYQGQVIATSIHMTFGGETSYHHGASASAFRKIPASYLLQWTAMTDALKRGDTIYNFWGIAPVQQYTGEWKILDDRHPFAGVTLFKTGFGGNLLPLQRCMDVPLGRMYHLTRGFERVRKWKRGF